jgi:hypothetical protein
MRMNKNWEKFGIEEKVASFMRKYNRGSISIKQLQDALTLLSKNQDPPVYPKEASTKDNEIGYWDETESELVNLAYKRYTKDPWCEGYAVGDMEIFLGFIDEIAGDVKFGREKVSREYITGE